MLIYGVLKGSLCHGIKRFIKTYTDGEHYAEEFDSPNYGLPIEFSRHVYLLKGFPSAFHIAKQPKKNTGNIISPET